MLILLKELLFWIINTFANSNAAGTILMYHSIGNNRKFSTVTPENFEHQLSYLKSYKFKVLPLSEMVKKIKNGEDLRNFTSLTFDDGYLDFFEKAFPVLKKYGFPATVFIPTGYIGRSILVSKGRDEFRVMDVSHLKEMVDSGLIEVMPHTVSHKKLTELEISEAKSEIEESRKRITEITGKSANLFAYPSGKYNGEIVDYLKDSGLWTGAVTVEQGVISVNSDVFMLPRNSIDSSVRMEQFKLKLSDGINTYLRLKKWIENKRS